MFDDGLPTLEDLLKVKNIDKLVSKDFFETCGPTDQWEKVLDKNGLAIKYADC